ncbi:nucleotidyltransferase domain-containing protein [Nonomuraea sp. NPDC050783]|uniref:DNA polymerase beta superfamily protein n=1 Tax=Nonomuraea sp. NPDC050783 TaxID=3154634 RepID=UPI0034654080
MDDDLILSVVMGSRAYGLDTGASDTDRRGVFAAPTAAFWRLDKPPTHRDGPLPEQFSWEVERFCRLALEADPTVLECLWSPLVEVATPAGLRLRELRGTASRWSRWAAPGAAAGGQEGRAAVAGGGRLAGRPGGGAGRRRARRAAGLHLMRTGELEADLTRLYGYGPAYLPELVAAKREAEHAPAPPVPGLAADALHDLVLGARLAGR